MDFTLVTNSFGMDLFRQHLSSVSEDMVIIGLDTETTALRPKDGNLRLMQLRVADKTFVIDVYCFNLEYIREVFKPIFENPKNRFVIQNSKFEIAWLGAKLGITPRAIFDTYLAAKLIDFDAKGSLAAIAKRYLDVDLDKTEQASNWAGELTPSQLEYASLDVLHLESLRSKLLKDIITTGQLEALKFETGVVPAITSMELAGMPLDYKKLEALVQSNTKIKDQKAADLLNFLRTRGGKREVPKSYLQDSLFEEDTVTLEDENAINIDSWQQVLPLYQAIGIPLTTTDQKYIAPLLSEYPEIKYLIEYRKYAKLASTYGTDLLSKIVNNRIFSDYQQIGTVTHRMASRNINLQNIPSTSDYRACFSPQEGRKLIVCLPGYVLVDTKRGKVKMEDLVAGDMALQPDGSYSKITRQWSNGFREVFKLVTDQGEVDATFNHKFMYSDGYTTEWRKVSQLNHGDHIVMPIGSKSRVLARIIDKFSVGKHEVFDITVPETSQFIANGFLTHNCDYAGFELRVLAAFSKDKTMLEAFREGLDLHSLTCAKLFGISYEEVEAGKKDKYKKARTSSKITNFSVAYGISPNALSDRILSYGVDTNPEEAQGFIDGWYKGYPDAARWLFWREKEILKNPEMRSPLGHRMLFKFDPKDGKQVGMAKRASRNFLIQNLNACATKEAMTNLYSKLQNYRDATMVNAVHDEIVVECNEEDSNEVSHLVESCMLDAAYKFLTGVKIQADAGICDSWAEK